MGNYLFKKAKNNVSFKWHSFSISNVLVFFKQAITKKWKNMEMKNNVSSSDIT